MWSIEELQVETGFGWRVRMKEEGEVSEAGAATQQDVGFVPREMFAGPKNPSAEFFRLVEDSLGAHAARKGYSENGADGENLLYKFTNSIGASAGHSVGEIIYKSVEYMKEPREVLLIKIAAWALLEWRYGQYSK